MKKKLKTEIITKSEWKWCNEITETLNDKMNERKNEKLKRED
jgi:hypothetical protein